MFSPTYFSHFASITALHLLSQLLLDRLQLVDLNLPPANAWDKEEPVYLRQSASGLAFMEAYACPTFSMGIFMMRKGTRIPIHDHPDMTVFTKVLLGRIQTQSYDIIVENGSKLEGNSVNMLRRVRVHPVRVLCASDGAVLSVSPESGHLHAIEAVETSVFVDVMGPPYHDDPQSNCTYYRPIHSASSYGQSYASSGNNNNSSCGSSSWNKSSSGDRNGTRSSTVCATTTTTTNTTTTSATTNTTTPKNLVSTEGWLAIDPKPVFDCDHVAYCGPRI